MKKISKYLFISVITFMMMIVKTDIVTAASIYDPVWDSEGLGMPATGGAQDTAGKAHFGTMPDNAVGVRITIVNYDGTKASDYSADYYYDSTFIKGVTYYNTGLQKHKTGIVNKEGGVSFSKGSPYGNSLKKINHEPLCSKSNFTGCNELYEEQIRSAFQKTPMEVPQVFSETGFCNTDAETCYKKTIEHADKLYVLIEPIVVINDVHTDVIVQKRMDEDGNDISNGEDWTILWEKPGNDENRSYVGTPTELDYHIYKNANYNEHPVHDYNNFILHDLDDCDSINEDTGKSECKRDHQLIQNWLIGSDASYLVNVDNGLLDKYYGFINYSNKNGLFYWVATTGKDAAGLYATRGATKMYLDGTESDTWRNSDFPLESEGKIYDYVSGNDIAERKEIYSTTRAFAMQIIWFRKIVDNECEPNEENLKTFIPACCDDEAYVNAYFEKHKPDNTDDDTRSDIINYCCDEESNSPFADKYDELFGQGSFETDKPEFCGKDQNVGMCSYSKGDKFIDECCKIPEYVEAYANFNEIATEDVYKNLCQESKNKKTCESVYNTGNCENGTQVTYTECGDLQEAIKDPSKASQYFSLSFDEKITEEQKPYLITDNNYCRTFCVKTIETDFDTGPNIYVSTLDSDNTNSISLLAGNYFTWDAKISESINCITSFNWDTIINDISSESLSVSNGGKGTVFRGDDGTSCSNKTMENSSNGLYWYGKIPEMSHNSTTCYRDEQISCSSRKIDEKTSEDYCDSDYSKSSDPDCPCKKTTIKTYYKDTYVVNGQKYVSCPTICENKGKCKTEGNSELKSIYDSHHGDQLACWYGNSTFYRKYTESYDKSTIEEKLGKLNECLSPSVSSSLENVTINYQYGISDVWSSGNIELVGKMESSKLELDEKVNKHSFNIDDAVVYGFSLSNNPLYWKYLSEDLEKECKVVGGGPCGIPKKDFLYYINSVFGVSESDYNKGVRVVDNYYDYMTFSKKTSKVFNLQENFNRYINSNGQFTNTSDDETDIDLGSSYMKASVKYESLVWDFDINYSGLDFKDADKIIGEEETEKYSCKFNIKNEFLVDNEDPDDPDPDEPCEGEGCELDLLAGDIKVIYRPIDLDDPFPGLDGTGRTTGANWCHLQLGDKIINSEEYENCDYLLRNYSNWYWAKYDCSNTNQIVSRFILNNRGVDGKKLYSEREPLYTIRLTPSIIKEIRKEYRTFDYTSRDDYIYEVDGDGTGGYLSLFINKYYQRMVDNERVIECLSGDEIFGDPDHYNRYWNSCFTGGVFK